MAEEYDLVILGGGTGGYVAAIRAAQEGLKTALVEKEKVGGTCLHKGCIPSKAFLRSAEVYASIKDSEKFGITVNDSSLEFPKVQERKNQIVNQLYQGVQHLLKKGDIDVFEGHGRILGPSIFSPNAGTISIEKKGRSENMMLLPKNVIVATGTRPRSLPGLETDGNYVLTSDDALAMEKLPSSMIIVGGGVIGVEWASMLTDFGVHVTIIESASRILPNEEQDISIEIKRRLEERGAVVLTNATINTDKITKTDKGITMPLEQNGEERQVLADQTLVSIGRKANVEDIGLENTDISLENGWISTNEFYQTKESHIYAIGDVIGGMQLAHAASREGIIAVEHMTGQSPLPLNYDLVPRCTYSRPEIASIGLTEKKARQEGYEVKTGVFSLKANGKAMIEGDPRGFLKLIANKVNDDILGVHIIGPHATELISEASLAKFVDASTFEIRETIHPHPALSEIIGEAALAVEGKAIHS